MHITKEQLIILMNAAYKAGFEASGEGWNGEVGGPFEYPDKVDVDGLLHYQEERDPTIAEIITTTKDEHGHYIVLE